MLIFLVFEAEEDKNKFEYLYHKYKRLMLHKSYQILQNYSLAEDAVSEAFIRIFKNLKKIEDTDSNSSVAFIMTIVKNVSLTMLKTEKKWEYEEVDDGIVSEKSVEATVISKISASEILRAAESLGEELQSVFLLKYAYEHSHAEIASLLGITENNVTVRLHRAKKKLLSLLEKEAYANG